mgnify:CR=1 FL=1
MIVIVYGPPGCGKTRNAGALAKAFQCDTVHDGSEPSLEALHQAGGSHLVLAQPSEVERLKSIYRSAPGGVRTIPWKSAAARARVR